MPPPPQGMGGYFRSSIYFPNIHTSNTPSRVQVGGPAATPPTTIHMEWISFHSICKESRHPRISEPVPFCTILMCCRYKPSTVRKTQNCAGLKFGFSLPLALSDSSLQTSHHQLQGQTQAREAEGGFTMGNTGRLSALPRVDASVQMRPGH